MSAAEKKTAMDVAYPLHRAVSLCRMLAAYAEGPMRVPLDGTSKEERMRLDTAALDVHNACNAIENIVDGVLSDLDKWDVGQL